MILNRNWIGTVAIVCWIGITAVKADDDRTPIKIRARYEIEPASQVGRVVVDCEIPAGLHIYSLQQSSPPGPTKIQIAESDQFDITAKFAADRQPTVIEHDPIFEKRLEQFTGKVSFTAPLQLSDGVDAEKLSIAMTINCQVCSDEGCVMVRNKKIDVSFGGFVEPKAAPTNPADPPAGDVPTDKIN